jgi:hypothetical protein
MAWNNVSSLIWLLKVSARVLISFCESEKCFPILEVVESLISSFFAHNLQAETLLGYLREQRQGFGCRAGAVVATSLAR